MKLGKVVMWIALVLLAACASREVLLPKSADVPAGVNLSGTWRIRHDPAQDQRRINEAIRKTDGMPDRVIVRQDQYGERSRIDRNQRSRGGLVHVFLENGRILKVTQTAGGLFLSFDRAVVQEYRFGENREVNIGPVVADRVSGWEGREYVAETLDRNNMKLIERLGLADDDTLRRTIVLRGKNGQFETIVQTFDRVQ